MKKLFICLLRSTVFYGVAQDTTEKIIPSQKQTLAIRATPQWFGYAKLGILTGKR
jgi:hypothetical protein